MVEVRFQQPAPDNLECQLCGFEPIRWGLPLCRGCHANIHYREAEDENKADANRIAISCAMLVLAVSLALMLIIPNMVKVPAFFGVVLLILPIVGPFVTFLAVKAQVSEGASSEIVAETIVSFERKSSSFMIGGISTPVDL